MIAIKTCTRQPKNKKYFLDKTFQDKNISPNSRSVFITMLFNCFLNSSIVEITYDDLMWSTGINSKATIAKCLKELIDAEMISKMGRSTFRLWYVSKREAEIAQDTLEIETENLCCHDSQSSNNELSNPTPNTPYKVIIISRHVDTEKNHDDSFDKRKEKGSRYKYRPGSPFKGLSKPYLSNLTKKFGYEAIQDRITKLEKCYNERFDKIGSAAGLLYSSLFKGKDWEYQNREDTIREEIIRDREREEKKMEKHWWEEKQHEKKVAIQNQRVRALENDPVLKQKCINKVKETHPTLEENSGMFKFLLRSALLKFEGVSYV